MELTGKTVCVLGAGSIGTECAKRFSAMGCRIVGLRRSPEPAQFYDEMLPMSEIRSVLPISDVVILSLPLTEESRGMIDGELIALMKDSTVFVNLSRGPIVNEADLVKAMKGGKLLGAV